MRFALGGNDGLFSSFLEWFQHTFVSIKALVSNHGSGLDGRQQDIVFVQPAGLSFGEMKTGRVAERIYRGVNFGAQSAFTASDGL